MTNEERFSFLEKSTYFQVKEDSVLEQHKVYIFRDDNSLFSLWVPNDEKREFKTFNVYDEINDEKTIIEETPIWFQELLFKTKEEIEKRDRLRQLMNGDKTEKK